MKNLLSLALAASLFTSASPLCADFDGRVVLRPVGCEDQGLCTLAENFGYLDRYGVGWQADAGFQTDGASIPKWAQSFAGEPFEPTYIPAAVLHDWYSKSERPVRGWFQTQRMFHEVLLVSGVAADRAALLYAGVLLGSGKWINGIASKPCPSTENCVNGVILEQSLIRSPETFESTNFRQDYEAMIERITSEGLTTPEDIETLAREIRPDDIFLFNPSGSVVEGSREY